jgi:hypothetical protein
MKRQMQAVAEVQLLQQLIPEVTVTLGLGQKKTYDLISEAIVV